MYPVGLSYWQCWPYHDMAAKALRFRPVECRSSSCKDEQSETALCRSYCSSVVVANYYKEGYVRKSFHSCSWRIWLPRDAPGMVESRGRSILSS